MITLTATIILADGTEIAINKHNALSVEQNIIDRSDIILPSWGIISNSGRISFIDRDGSIKGYAQNLQLTPETEINLYINDTISGASTQIGDFFAENWEYDSNNFEVRASFTDGLQRLQDIAVSQKYDLINNVQQRSALSVYEFLYNNTDQAGFTMLEATALDEDTYKHFLNMSIAYNNIEPTNLWRAWQDFCVACQLHIYKNSQGVIVCVYNGGD